MREGPPGPGVGAWGRFILIYLFWIGVNGPRSMPGGHGRTPARSLRGAAPAPGPLTGPLRPQRPPRGVWPLAFSEAPNRRQKSKQHSKAKALLGTPVTAPLTFANAPPFTPSLHMPKSTPPPSSASRALAARHTDYSSHQPPRVPAARRRPCAREARWELESPWEERRCGELCHLIGWKRGRAGAKRRAVVKPMAMKYM